jgi:hypothetical protein
MSQRGERQTAAYARAKKLHEERTEGRSALPPKPRGGSGLSAAEMVPADKLAVVLREWIQRYTGERDPRIQRPSPGTRGELTMSAQQYIVCWSGIQLRVLTGILNGEKTNVTFETAEKLLMVIGREYMLATGEVPVVPNPQWSQETFRQYMEERGVCY